MMDLVRWNPWNEVSQIRNRISTLFGDSPFPALFEGEGRLADFSPAVDVFEADDKVVIKAELPGMDKNDIHLNVQNGVLSLRGERKSENEEKQGQFYRREISHGSFLRLFALPVDVDADKIGAEFKDGILTIAVHKPESRKPKQITVN